MIYRGYSLRSVRFRDINTGDPIYAEYANTATGEIRGQILDHQKNASATKKHVKMVRSIRAFRGIVAFDVIDNKTGHVIDKARP